MAELTLIIGNKNYSSWSLRGYLVIAQTGAAFEEVLIPLSRADSKERLAKETPRSLVPVLRVDGEALWDSLAIAEYCAERWPKAGLWPADALDRARARSVCAEMHSGFYPLRKNMPMDIRSERPGSGRTPAVLADIERIQAVWTECIERSGGPFLFGTGFSIADAFYAPVVSRFRTYGVPIEGACAAFAEAVWAHGPFQAWVRDARKEPWTIDPPVL